MNSTRFPQAERQLLLSTPGLGERIVERLEEAGFASLLKLHAQGLDRVMEQVGPAVCNRRRALRRALDAASAPTNLRAGA